jgi:hypothetical protein
MSGKYSRSLPEHTAQRCDEARSGPALVQLRDELALTDALLVDYLEALKESGDASAASEAFERLKQAMKSGDFSQMTAALAAMDRAFQAHAPHSAAVARAQILDLIEVRRKLVVTEARRQRILHAAMTTEQGMEIVGAFTRAVMDCVPDRAAQARISAAFSRLLTTAPVVDSAARSRSRNINFLPGNGDGSGL